MSIGKAFTVIANILDPRPARELLEAKRRIAELSAERDKLKTPPDMWQAERTEDGRRGCPTTEPPSGFVAIGAWEPMAPAAGSGFTWRRPLRWVSGDDAQLAQAKMLASMADKISYDAEQLLRSVACGFCKTGSFIGHKPELLTVLVSAGMVTAPTVTMVGEAYIERCDKGLASRVASTK